MRSVTYVDAEPMVVFRLDVDDSPFERDEPARALQEAAEKERLGERGYELRVRRTYFSWGADASMHEVLLLVGEWAASGAVGAAVWAALTGLKRKVTELRRQPSVARTLDRDEAVQRADWHVRQVFELGDAVVVSVDPEGEMVSEPGHALEVIGETLDATTGEWKIEMRDDEWTYSVVLSEEESLALLVRIERQRRSLDE